MFGEMRWLVDTAWLETSLGSPDLRVVDASWHLPAEERDPGSEYLAEHIPGAVFFDIEEICDGDSSLPHMLPPAEKFASRVRALGLGDGNRIVVYDSTGLLSAARVWWMFRVFGHEEVAVLDGGLPKWKAEGRPVEDMQPSPRSRHFTPRANWLLVRDGDQVARALEGDTEQVVDARSPGRFRGEEAEPRPGLRCGHMPGAVNLHYQSLLGACGVMLDQASLQARIVEAGIDLQRPVITSCGSGITAAVINLALHMLGHERNAVYDGSWADWGREDSGRPVA